MPEVEPQQLADSTPSAFRIAAAEAILLSQISERLTSLETQVIKAADSRPSKSPLILELSKIVFGGWPALGLVFLLLFFVPVRDALQAIPEKVRTADEIGLPGVSLKSTLRSEASKSGVEALGDTLPTLSQGAIELLLRTDRNTRYGLVSRSSDSEGRTIRVSFPSAQQLQLIGELEGKGLADVETDSSGKQRRGVDSLRAAIEEFKKRHPGRGAAEFGSSDRDSWTLDTPIRGDLEKEIQVFWGATDLGKQAIDVIFRAVGSALAPRPSGEQRKGTR